MVLHRATDRGLRFSRPQMRDPEHRSQIMLLQIALRDRVDARRTKVHLLCFVNG